ncbi:hypothetical protein D9M69_688550 [compost metagenome]
MLSSVATMSEDSLCAGTSTATLGRGPGANGRDRAGRQASNTWADNTNTGGTMSTSSALNSQPSNVIMLVP